MRVVWVAICGLSFFVSFYLAISGRMAWWVPGVCGLLTAIFVLEPKILALQVRRRKQVLQITDEGVRRELANGEHEAVRWAELTEVWVLTTDDGPYGEDVYFALVSTNGKGVAVPNGLAVQHDLLAHLQKLPGFDNTAVVAAMGSTTNQRFVVWRAPNAAPISALN